MADVCVLENEVSHFTSSRLGHRKKGAHQVKLLIKTDWRGSLFLPPAKQTEYAQQEQGPGRRFRNISSGVRYAHPKLITDLAIRPLVSFADFRKFERCSNNIKDRIVALQERHFLIKIIQGIIRKELDRAIASDIAIDDKRFHQIVQIDFQVPVQGQVTNDFAFQEESGAFFNDDITAGRSGQVKHAVAGHLNVAVAAQGSAPCDRFTFFRSESDRLTVCDGRVQIGRPARAVGSERSVAKVDGVSVIGGRDRRRRG